MISIADILFVVGVACAVAGCWLKTVPDGLIGLGIALCLGAFVVRRIQLARRRRKR